MTGGVPASAVEQQDGMRPSGHGARDLVQVELHGFGVGVGHRQTGSRAARRTDSPEQVGAVVALVSRLARAGAAAHCRTIPFFWPRRISSWNQISTGLLVERWARWALSVVGKFF